MSLESNWPWRLWIRLWTVCFVGAFLFGAAHVGSAALDWFERTHGPVVTSQAGGLQLRSHGIELEMPPDDAGPS
jgi:hypothetical protein